MATATEDAKAVDFRETAGDDVHGRALPNLGETIVHVCEGVHGVARTWAPRQSPQGEFEPQL